MRSQLNLRQLTSNKGFTIIEMAIVMIIVGLFLAGAAQLYVQFERAQKEADVRLDIPQINIAISNYRALNGRYPCPASMTVNREDPATYGLETDCSDTSGPDFAAGAGVTAAGVATTIAANGASRVRIGMIPFRALNLQEEQAYDGYRNRYLYAVTEDLAVSATFTANGGAISILNDQNSSAIEPADSAHFVVLSGGENGAGVYNSRGVLNPCTAGSQESENCDFTVNTTFKLAERGNIGDGVQGQYDDEIMYATHSDIPLWETSATDPLDATMKPGGNIGVGPGASQTPDEELQVDGVVRAQDDPDTPDVVEGKIQTNNVCDYGSNTNDCFTPNLIGGELATGGGMECPPGEFMVGVRDGGPVCKDEVQVRCDDPDDVVVGINSDGTLDCNEPPARCETTTVNWCGEDKTLFAASEGTERTLSFGWQKRARYECWDNTWYLDADWGQCACTEYTYEDTNRSCGTPHWDSNCGSQYTGSRHIRVTRQCPSGDYLIEPLSGTCNCITTSETDVDNCPWGFNRGDIRTTRTNTCTNNVASCGPEVVNNSCRCEQETQTARWHCPNGLSGRYTVRRQFTCPDGSSNRGYWGSWEEDPNDGIAQNCVCQPSTEISERDCDGGLVGKIKVTKVRSCPSNTVTTTEDASACTEPPPVFCSWTNFSSSGGQPTSNSSGNLFGQQCDCGANVGITSCKKLVGDKYQSGNCLCK